YPRDDRDADVLNTLQKITQLTGIEYRLRDRILRARFDLPLEPFDLFLKVDRSRIHANADTERGRLTDGIVSEIETMVQLIDHVRQTNRIDIEDGRCVRVWSHLRRIASDDENVAEAKRGGAEQIRHHAEKVPVATAIVQHRLDPDLLFDEYRCRDRAHARLRACAVGNVHTVNTCVFQQANRVKRFLRVDTF